MSDRAGGGGADHLEISVVIPAWGDAENLRGLLPNLVRSNHVVETIVVDASGDAAAEEVVREFGAIFLAFGRPNRGAQMNAGAAHASGEVLLFQHADTDLTEPHLSAIASALRDPGIIGGAFYRKFDDRHPRLMWLESVARFLTRKGGTFYGDQSVFVRRDVFHQLGGFADIPLMEDMEFSRRFRAAGKVAVLDPPIQTSPRRHTQEGAWKVTIQNALLILLYKVGVPPHRLHRWYYAGRRRQQAARVPAAPAGSRSFE